LGVALAMGESVQDAVTLAKTSAAAINVTG